MKKKYDINVILIDLIMLYSYYKIIHYIELNLKKVIIRVIRYLHIGTYLPTYNIISIVNNFQDNY